MVFESGSWKRKTQASTIGSSSDEIIDLKGVERRLSIRWIYVLLDILIIYEEIRYRAQQT